jgi:nucleoside-triphosphatase THEP1
MSGIVGCGKTTTLLRIQEGLRKENRVLVSRSLAVDKGGSAHETEKIVR